MHSKEAKRKSLQERKITLLVCPTHRGLVCLSFAFKRVELQLLTSLNSMPDPAAKEVSDLDRWYEANIERLNKAKERRNKAAGAFASRNKPETDEEAQVLLWCMTQPHTGQL